MLDHCGVALSMPGLYNTIGERFHYMKACLQGCLGAVEIILYYHSKREDRRVSR